MNYVMLNKLNFIFYLLLIVKTVFSNEIEKKLLYYHNNFMIPIEFEKKKNVSGITNRFIYSLDPLPESIRVELLTLLEEKAGKKWSDIIFFIRADEEYAQSDSLKENPTFIIWFGFNVTGNSRYLFSIYASLKSKINYLPFPSITNEEYKKNVLSIFDAWKKVQMTEKKCSKLYMANLNYNKNCDELQWDFQYKRKKITFFRGDHNIFNIFINAHTGEVIFHEDCTKGDIFEAINKCKQMSIGTNNTDVK